MARAHDGHWAILTGCRKGSVPAALAAASPAAWPAPPQPYPVNFTAYGQNLSHLSSAAALRAAARELRLLTRMFGRGNVYVELISHDEPADDERNDALFELAAATGLPVVASSNVHYASPSKARLAQALAAIRARRSLAEMDGWLAASGGAFQIRHRDSARQNTTRACGSGPSAGPRLRLGLHGRRARPARFPSPAESETGCPRPGRAPRPGPVRPAPGRVGRRLRADRPGLAVIEELVPGYFLIVG